MNEELLNKLNRVEALVVTLTTLVCPTMRFDEVQQMLGLKSRKAVNAWLRSKNIKAHERRYDRARVVSAVMG